MIKKNYIYSIGEIVRERLLIDVKSNSHLTIRNAIESGELKAFKSIKKLNSEQGKVVYSIAGEELEKYREKRKKYLAKSPLPYWQQRVVKSKSKKDAIYYLKERGFNQSIIAREVGISRQYVNEVLNYGKK